MIEIKKVLKEDITLVLEEHRDITSIAGLFAMYDKKDILGSVAYGEDRESGCVEILSFSQRSLEERFIIDGLFRAVINYGSLENFEFFTISPNALEAIVTTLQYDVLANGERYNIEEFFANNKNCDKQ